MRKTTALFLAGVLGLAAVAFAATPSNAVLVTSTAQVAYDAGSGLYTYQYSFANDPTSALEVNKIMIPLNGAAAVNVVPPTGWQGDVWSDGSTVQFTATEGVVVPPGFIDTGGLLPSVYQIKPGGNLSGFSFQSTTPPDFIAFFAQGFTQLPLLGVDVPDPDDPVPPTSAFDPTVSFQGPAVGPRFSSQLFPGGRRPAVDGFLEFENFVDRGTKIIPVEIDIVFGVNGEKVDQSTFSATLNGQDVTADFKVTGPNTRRAVFQASHPALEINTGNVLLTKVDGIVPGTTHTATDTDRVTFTAVLP